MFVRAEFPCPILDATAERFRETAEFYSFFFKPSHAVFKPIFQNGTREALLEAIQSTLLVNTIPRLHPINIKAATSFSILNQYELEGSLVAKLVHGTCTEKIVSDELEARQLVRTIFECLLPKPHQMLRAYRFDDPAWSALTNRATLSWAYLVIEPTQPLWWFVCMADDY